jgi:hypothetical protein
LSISVVFFETVFGGKRQSAAVATLHKSASEMRLKTEKSK